MPKNQTAPQTQYNPRITPPGGRSISYYEDPKKYTRRVARDIKRYMGRPLGLFGREKKKQQRMMNVGELLGMMPQGAAGHAYQMAFPFQLKGASDMIIELPGGQQIKVAKEYDIPVTIKGVSVEERRLDEPSHLPCGTRIPWEQRPKVQYLQVRYKRQGDNYGGFLGGSRIDLPISSDPPKVNASANLKLIVPDDQMGEKAASYLLELPNGQQIKVAKDYELPITIKGVSVRERALPRSVSSRGGCHASCDSYENRPKVKYLSLDYSSDVIDKDHYNSSIDLPITADPPKINSSATLKISIPDEQMSQKAASITLPSGRQIKVGKEYKIPITIKGVSVEEDTIDDDDKCTPCDTESVSYKDKPKIKYLSVEYNSNVRGKDQRGGSVDLPISSDAPKINSSAELTISIPDDQMSEKASSVVLPSGRQIKLAKKKLEFGGSLLDPKAWGGPSGRITALKQFPAGRPTLGARAGKYMRQAGRFVTAHPGATAAGLGALAFGGAALASGRKQGETRKEHRGRITKRALVGGATSGTIAALAGLGLRGYQTGVTERLKRFA